MFIPRATEDGDTCAQPEGESYEHNSAQQLEDELQMEEYLRRELQDDTCQVRGARPAAHPAVRARWSCVSLLPPPFPEYSDCSLVFVFQTVQILNTS